MTEEAIKQILQNPWVALVGYIAGVTGIVGLVLSIYALKRPPYSKMLCYKLKGSNVISPSASQLDHLVIKFADSVICSLTETIVLIWNSGNVAVTQSDFAQDCGLKLVVPNGQRILSCEALVADRPGVEFHVGPPDGSEAAPLDLYLMERGAGVLLKVIHTSPNPLSLVVAGSVTDFGSPRRTTNKSRKDLFDRMFDGFTACVALLCASSIMEMHMHWGMKGLAILAVLVASVVLTVGWGIIRVFPLFLRFGKHAPDCARIKFHAYGG